MSPQHPGETEATLFALRDRLRQRGIKVTGPHPGSPSPERDFLKLPGSRRVVVQLDQGGFWQAHVYDRAGRLVRMADVDGGDWPGDRV